MSAFDDVIAKGMAKKPAKRYQTAGELAVAAGRALETPVRTTGRSGRHSRQPLRRALEHLMQTREYRTIATLWGLEKGMIDKPVINGAVR